jgi:MFS family permease
MCTRVFYGWWIVTGCLIATLMGNALGFYGAGVYLHAVAESKGWPTGLVSGAVTLFYMTSALLLIPVGSAISRLGPGPVIGLGAFATAVGVAGIGRAGELWQAYGAFLVMGIGWASLSMTAIATTLAPWFERYQGRAISIASLGASVGGMAGVPALLFGIRRVGFGVTTTVAAVAVIAVLLPLACFVLKRRPQDLGLLPDGETPRRTVGTNGASHWTRAEALRTNALRSVVATFGIGMMVQIGFLTHQVTLILPSLGVSGTSTTVAATAIAALLGRLVLTRFADQINERTMAAAVLALAATALTMLALLPAPMVLVGGSVLFGLAVGNVTTLSPIIIRREFGAVSFGAIFGTASSGIQLTAALGPSLFGLLHDVSGSYRLPLLIGAMLDIVAATTIACSAPRQSGH